MNYNYRGGTTKIPIGKASWDGKTVYYIDRRFGVTLFIAKSRFGKTALAKNIVVQIGKYRSVLIFDYLGEWKTINECNWRSPYPDRLEDLTVIENFGFKISDFPSDYWWSALGFPPRASDILGHYATLVDVHQDDPNLFEELIMALPSRDRDVTNFNEQYKEYNLELSARFAEATIISIRNTWFFVKSIFIDPADDPETKRFHITDWGADNWGEFFCENPHLLVNLRLDRVEADRFRARIMVGRILEDIAPYLGRLKPLIVVEEADVLAPSFNQNIECPSLDEFIRYSKKHQKRGVSLIYIMQDQGQFNEDCYEGWHQKVMGIVPRGNEHYELTEHLRWNPDTNFREFVFVEANGRYTRFIPDMTCCRA